MNRQTLTRIATLSLMLGISTVACTPHDSHVAALGDSAPDKASVAAAKQAARAQEALAHNKATVAVAAAERAVGAMPRDAGYRLLLGQAYLAAGRFASAQTAFQDTLALAPDQPRARFDLAMAETAQGEGARALPTFHALAGTVPATDLGLAIVMAGDHAGGIQMLVDAARSPQSTARTRQNLALAFALDGRWREARAVAMQDTPPDRINDQIARWAELSLPQAAPQQVAAMLGVKPASDPGQPTELALAEPTPAQAPTALASALPLAGAATSPAMPAPTQPAVTLASAAATPGVSVPVAAPLPAPVRVATSTPARSVTLPLAAPQPIARAVVRPPVLLASASRDQTPRLLRAPAQPVRRTVYRSDGRWAVQLGAFSRAGAVQTAWSTVSRMAPTLAGYTPARGHIALSGGTFVRLSVTGLPSRGAAVALCRHVRARGGACFVRLSAGDAPLQWVRRDTGTEIASR